MTPRLLKSEKTHSLVVGATGGTAIYHLLVTKGLVGPDYKEVVGHIVPWLSFLIGWTWIVVHQETIGRLNIYRIKLACQRRMREIEQQLAMPSINADRKRKLQREYDDCVEVIQQVSVDDLRRRLATAIAS